MFSPRAAVFLTLCRLCGNNRFLFIPLAHGWGLSHALCCFPCCLCLSLCFVETWVWCRGENFSMTEINTPSSHGSIPFPFCFSLTIVIPACCLLHSTAPSCLHIVWSKATNCSLTACSLSAFSFTSLRSCLHWCLCSTHLRSQDDFRWAQKNKMQLKELKGHKSFCCWQGGAVSRSHHS